MTVTYKAVETTYYNPDTGELEELEYYVYTGDGKKPWIPVLRDGQKSVQIIVEYEPKGER